MYVMYFQWHNITFKKKEQIFIGKNSYIHSEMVKDALNLSLMTLDEKIILFNRVARPVL